MIYTLSPYQIGYLRAVFERERAPLPYRITVEWLAMTDEGNLIVGIIDRGQSQRYNVPREAPTP